MSKRAKWILLCVVTIVIAVLVRLLPFPTHYRMDMTFTDVTPGAVAEPQTVTLEGWKLNYLFKRDQITVEPFYLDAFGEYQLKLENEAYVYTEYSELYDYTSWHVYWPALNRYTSAKLYMSKAQDWCFLIIGGELYLAGTASDSIDPAGIPGLCGIELE